MGDDGLPLVELPGNYLAMVESLLVARRHEYAALDGWLGFTRFESESVIVDSKIGSCLVLANFSTALGSSLA